MTSQKVAAAKETFTIWAFFDPLYRYPLVLGTNLTVRPETVFRLFLDRWPVEKVPLVAKQLLGLERQFVFDPASRERLPELALLAANVLTYLAAVLPPCPLASGIGSRSAPLDGCGGCWLRPVFRKITPWRGEFGKSGQSRPTCPRALRPADAGKPLSWWLPA